MKKIFLCLGVMIGTMFFTLSAYAATYTVESASELATAMSKAASESSTTIKIAGTFTISKQIQIKDGMNVTLDRIKGSYIRRSSSLQSTAPLFYVYPGGTLNLKATSGTFTIKGNASEGVNAQAALIYVSGGALNISQNVKITDCNNVSQSSSGAAIRILNGGVFNMNGGSITGNNTATANGGAISVSGGSVVNLNSGVISDNKSGGNGGGVYASGTDLNIGNITVSGNSAVLGDGIYVANSTSGNSNVTLSEKPSISDVIYAGCELGIAASLNSEALFNLDFPQYTIGMKVLSCEQTDISTYKKCFNLKNTDYCLRQSADNSLCLSRQFTVVFRDYDGAAIKSDTVFYDENANAPDNPKRNGYKFICWDNSYNNVQSDVVCTAKYEKLNTVRLYLDGEQHTSSIVNADGQFHSISAKAYSDDCMLILGIYKDNSLTDVKISKVGEDGLYSAEISSRLIEGETIKAMLFDIFETCKPLCKSVEATVIQGE